MSHPAPIQGNVVVTRDELGAIVLVSRQDEEGHILSVIAEAPPRPRGPTFQTFALGTRVRKPRGSQWTGRVVGWYSTELTPEGYAVESETEVGSVQIYPASALERCPPQLP